MRRTFGLTAFLLLTLSLFLPAGSAQASATDASFCQQFYERVASNPAGCWLKFGDWDERNAANYKPELLQACIDTFKVCCECSGDRSPVPAATVPADGQRPIKLVH